MTQKQGSIFDDGLCLGLYLIFLHFYGLFEHFQIFTFVEFIHNVCANSEKSFAVMLTNNRKW